MASKKSPPGMTCCLKNCQESATKILPGEGHVDVRAFEPKIKNIHILVVSWKPGGEAAFHKSCWAALVKATKVGSTSQIELTDLERSMIMEATKTAEYHDGESSLQRKAAQIATLLKSSLYPIAFTGAGISTAAGIGDFRGINGKWTQRSKEKNYGSKGAAAAKAKGHILEQLRPTYCHEALVKLMEMGLIKFLISQNTDGLHRLSGIPVNQLAELHGNSFIEKCEKCDLRYERAFACRQNKEPCPPHKCPKCKLNHRTGRKCTKKDCSSYLMNTIINFGDYLESDILDSASYHALCSDTVLVLGSTLRVSPANDLVTSGKDPHHIIICNRQTTPYDEDCTDPGPDGEPLGVRVFGDCDRLMRAIMKNLLSETELQKWEGSREERLVEYGVRRNSVQ